MLFCRLLRPLNTTRRLLLLLPPDADRRSDLQALLQDAKWLARQVGADLRLYLAGPIAGTLRQLAEKTPPTRPLTVLVDDTPEASRERLLHELADGDLVFMLGERPTGASWSPTLEAWAAQLVVRFPYNNLLLAYQAPLHDSALLDLQEVVPVPAAPQ